MENFARFERYLLKSVPATIEARMRERLETLANDLVADLKARAPVYSGDKLQRVWNGRVYPVIPGALRDSIGWTWGKAPKNSFGLGSFDVSDGLRITFYAGGTSDVFYHRWVEFGTERWEGSPFFYGTYRDNKRRIRGGITRALRRALKDLNSGKF